MFQQAGIMPMRPLRNTVAGEITKGGSYRKVHRYIKPVDLCREKYNGRDKEGGVYVSIFVSYLFRSHASSKPHKKRRGDFWPKHACCCIVDTMAENGAANMLLSHTFAWYFFYLRFVCPVFFLDIDEKRRYLQSINDQTCCTRCAN